MKKQLTLLALLAAMLLPLGAAAQITLPYSTGFEDDDVSEWTIVNGSNGWYVGTATSNGGSKSLYISNTNGSTNAYNINTTSVSWAYVQMTATAGYYAISFDWKGNGENVNHDYLRVFAVPHGATYAANTLPDGYTSEYTFLSYIPTGWVEIFHRLNLSTAWQQAQAIFALPTDGDWDIVFMWTNDGSVGNNPPAALDNVSIAQLTCSAPSNLAASDITETSANISWTATNSESEWIVSVDGTEQIVSSNSLALTDLAASSLHTVSVRAICEPGDTSFSATTTFRTLCGVATLPWDEDFETYTTGNGNRPDCWGVLSQYTSGSTNYPYIYTNSGSKTFYMYTYNTPNFVATPMFNAAPNQLHVVFRASASSSGTTRLFEAGVMTDTADQSTFRALVSFNGNSNTWTEYEFFTDTVSLEGESCYVAFRWTSSGGYSAYIDDVAVEVASDCRRPESASVSQPTYEGATVSWTDNGTAATGYTVRVATTNNVNDANAVDMPFAASPAVLTGLASNTTYYVWVATNCGSEQTMWRTAGSFTTQRDCYPVTGLAVADANQTSAALTWTYQDGIGREATGVSIRIVDQTTHDTTYQTATGTAAFITDLSAGHSYSVSVTTQCDGDFEAYSDATASFETSSCGQLQGNSTSSYSPFNGNYNYGYSQTVYPASALQGLSEITGIKYRVSSVPQSLYNRSIKVYIANTTQTLLDTNNYVAIDDLTLVYDGSINVSTTGWKTINFSEAFTWDGTSNVVVAVQNLTGEYKSFNWGAHTATEGNTVYWYRDGDTITAENPNAPTATGTSAPSRAKSTTVPDITFIGDCETPTCLAPIAAFTGSTENTATIEWIAGSEETSWTVEYRPYGDTAWQTAVASTSQTTYTVGGLEASTLYEFRVGSLCGDATLYGPAFSGRTACGTIVLPYTETFEGWNTGEFPTCWFRTQEYVSSSSHYPYIGSTAHNSSRAMYIYGSSATGIIASPAVPADADNIKVTFWANTSYATPTNGCLKVGVLTNSADPSSFIECTAVATGIIDGNWREYEFYTDNVTAEGPVHVAFKWQLSSSNNSGYIDDVTISEAGNCRKPNTPSRDNIGYYSATLHWNDVNHGSTTYDVRYSTVNDVEADGYQTATATGDNITLTGLHNGTTYYAWVRPQCNTELDWLAIPSFTTLVSCYPVTGISLTGRTFTTAALGWNYSTNGMSPAGVLLSLMDMTDSTMVVENEEVSGTSHILTGLAGGHSYTAYFMTLCDPDTSAAVTYNFNIEMPNCGEQPSTTSSDYLPLKGNYNYGYTQAIYPASLFAGNDTLFGISYQISTAPNNYPVRTIDVYIGTPGGRTSLDTNNFVPVSELTQVADSFPLQVGATGWTTIMFDTPYELPADSNIVIAICNRTGHYNGITWRGYTDNNYAVYWYRDGAYVDPADPNAFYNGYAPTRGKTYTVPSIQVIGNCDLDNVCTAPIVIIDSTGTTSVSLQWAADGATQFTVEHRETGADTWITDATGISATTYTVTGLQPATSYDFRVGSQCSDDNTVYSATATTYTECDAMAVPTTFTFTTALSPCWTLTNSNVSRNTSENALAWSYSSSNIGTAVLPELDQPVNTLMAVINARYSYYNGSPYRMLVGVGDANGSGITWVDTIDLSNSYTDYIVYFSGYTGTGDRIVISKEGGNYLYIQSIEVGLDNGCHPVSTFSAGTTTATTADLSWSHQSATDFEVQYRLVGADTWQSQTFSGTNGTLTGLQPSSSYQARVRAACTATDSSVWSPTVSFATACAAVDMPWSENFDALGSMNDLGCWNRYTGLYDDATGTASLSNGTSWTTSTVAVLENKHVKLNIYGTSCYHWLVTPEINISENADLTFDIALTAYASANAPSVNNVADDRFLVLATTDGGATWTPLAEWSSDEDADYDYTALGTTTGNITIALEQFVGQSIRIAFYGESTFSGGDNDLHIDNVGVEANGETPVVPCETPSAISFSNVGTSQATASWTYSGSANQWQVELSTGGNVQNTYNANENHFTLSGLSEGTSYSVRVRTVCDANTYSDWSAAATFTTDTTGGSHEGIATADLSAISLSPNPATSVVTVGGLEAGAQLTIVDLNGRTVARYDVVNTEMEINVANLTKGAYFVRIVSPNGTAVRKLVVK